MDLTDPIATALATADALERSNRAYALYGGLLLAAYGEPRETHDVDVAVADVTAGEARQAVETGGLRTTISFEDVVFGGLSISRLALFGGDEDTGLNVLDLVCARSPRYRAASMTRSVVVSLRGRSIRALAADDFVVYKALATRDRDVDDAASVVRRSADLLDFAAIDVEIANLAHEIADWDVRSRWQLIRARAGRP